MVPNPHTCEYLRNGNEHQRRTGLQGVGSPPVNANTAGMIIRPAMMAMAVSNTSTFPVDASMDTSFFI